MQTQQVNIPFTDPTRTILTWNEVGNLTAQKIEEAKLRQVTTEEDLNTMLDALELDLMETFEQYFWVMMTRADLFAAENMNRINPEYHFSTQWTPADDKLLQELLDGCNKYLTKWTQDIRTEAATEIREGIAAGESLQQIGTRVSDVIDSQKNRGVLIARTELMRAFNNMAKKRYEQAGFEPKWLTAHDPKVCNICEPCDGKTLKELNRSPPPAHPDCRCTIVPEVNEE